MRMDATQRGWAWFSSGIFVASAVVYVFYVMNAPAGPRGGSAIGLTFGIVGFAFMIFAALLGARKRVPTWRLGRAQTWMRGHLWLGLLSLPLILFHGGFHFGGMLTRVLMWLLIVTVGSGLFGATLQHYVPRMMTDGCSAGNDLRRNCECAPFPARRGGPRGGSTLRLARACEE